MVRISGILSRCDSHEEAGEDSLIVVTGWILWVVSSSSPSPLSHASNTNATKYRESQMLHVLYFFPANSLYTTYQVGTHPPKLDPPPILGQTA